MSTPPSNNQSVRSWVFTLNNWTEEEYEKILELDFTRVCIGKEVGAQGTPHLQGVIVLRSPSRRAGLKAKIGQRVHLEPMFGTYQQASDYCKKGGDYYEKDTRESTGQKLQDYVRRCRTGATSMELMEEFPALWARYPNLRERVLLNTARVRERDEAPTVIWIYGPTGTGKTRGVYAEHGEDLIDSVVFTKSGFLLGYTGRPVILIDDFRAGACDFDFLLRILDRYPIPINVKNGMIQWKPKTIYITSPHGPADTFGHLGNEDLAQLTRRITEVRATEMNFSDLF